MGNKIEVLIAQGLDVPIFFNNVPNFVKDVPKGPIRFEVGNDLQSLSKVVQRNK